MQVYYESSISLLHDSLCRKRRLPMGVFDIIFYHFPMHNKLQSIHIFIPTIYHTISFMPYVLKSISDAHLLENKITYWFPSVYKVLSTTNTLYIYEYFISTYISFYPSMHDYINNMSSLFPLPNQLSRIHSDSISIHSVVTLYHTFFHSIQRIISILYVPEYKVQFYDIQSFTRSIFLLSSSI